jgi:predicted small metal-binding protein
VAVEDEVGEQVTALAPRQLVLQPAALALDYERAAELDPGADCRFQGHANILVLQFETKEVNTMARIIRCECGFIARGQTDDELIDTIQGHMRTDHPTLLESVKRQDLLGWIQLE